MLLAMENVSAAYGKRTVLAGIDLAVDPGEVVVVLGPNGSGKSTLLRLACGLMLPREGRVLLDGRDTRTLERRQAARLAALAPAEPFLDAPLTVAQVLADAAFARHRGWFPAADLREEVVRAAALFELEGLLPRHCGELSTGERARLALARCVLQASPLFLLDEPSGRLDYRHREMLVEWVRKEAAAGRGFLVAEHNLQVAQRLADRFVLLKNGRQAACCNRHRLDAATLENIYGVRFTVAQSPEGRVLLPAGLSDTAAGGTL